MSGNRDANDVSLNIFDLIDSICADFRKQWKEGRRPRIEEFVERVPEDARPTLFRNVLSVEIRCRQVSKEKPTSADYLQRFPKFARIVRECFLEPSRLSLEAIPNNAADDDDDIPPTIDLPAANRLGDYELIRELGRGGFGVVYEARHLKRRERVALKTLPTGLTRQPQVSDGAERLHRFRREFRNLSEVNHPNLVGMQTLEVDGQQWFLTMDLIEGVDFLEYVRPDGRADEARLRNLLPQMVTAILALHSQHILHCDLKPSNVMVDSTGLVHVLDFGLASEIDRSHGFGQIGGIHRYRSIRRSRTSVRHPIGQV